MIHGETTALLGRHVVNGPENLTRQRKRRARRPPFEELCDPEIENLDQDAVRRRLEKHIAGLQIPVDYTERVRGVYCRTDAPHQLDREVDREPAMSCYFVLERPTLEEFEHEVRANSRVDAGIVD